MDYVMVGGICVIVGFAIGFVVASHNPKQAEQTASVIAAVNSAKDAITAHTTATAALAPATVPVKPAA